MELGWGDPVAGDEEGGRWVGRGLAAARVAAGRRWRASRELDALPAVDGAVASPRRGRLGREARGPKPEHTSRDRAHEVQRRTKPCRAGPRGINLRDPVASAQLEHRAGTSAADVRGARVPAPDPNMAGTYEDYKRMADTPVNKNCSGL